VPAPDSSSGLQRKARRTLKKATDAAFQRRKFFIYRASMKGIYHIIKRVLEMNGSAHMAADSPAITSSPRHMLRSGLFVLSGLGTKNGAF